RSFAASEERLGESAIRSDEWRPQGVGEDGITGIVRGEGITERRGPADETARRHDRDGKLDELSDRDVAGSGEDGLETHQASDRGRALWVDEVRCPQLDIAFRGCPE